MNRLQPPFAKGTLIEDILPQDPKLALSHDALCFDAMEQLSLSSLQHALVKNSTGGHLGVISLKALQALSRDELQSPIREKIEKVTDICTPQCDAAAVYTRLQENKTPYVLVVDHSGRLLNFIEMAEFTTSS